MDNKKDLEVQNVVKNLLSLYPLLAKSLKGFKNDLNTDINKGDLMILLLIDRHKKLTMSEIGGKLHMVKPHVTAHVNRLIINKYVQRGYDENDRRVIYISLTEKGKEITQSIYATISNNLSKVIETLENEKIHTLNNALITIKEILNELVNNK